MAHPFLDHVWVIVGAIQQLCNVRILCRISFQVPVVSTAAYGQQAMMVTARSKATWSASNINAAAAADMCLASATRVCRWRRHHLLLRCATTVPGQLLCA